MLKLLNIKRITPSQEEVLKNLFTKKIGQYTPSITFLTKYQQEKFKKRCVEENIRKSYEIDVNYKYKNDYNKTPFLIYLTKEKAKENIRALKSEKKYTIKFSGLNFKKVCRETLNNNYKFSHVIANIKSSEGDDNPGIYFPPKDNYWSMPSSKEVKLYKQPSKKTITIGSKKRPKELISNFIKKDKIENYYPSKVYLEEKVLKSYLKRIKKNLKVEEKFGQSKLIKNKKEFYFPMSKVNFPGTKGFILYLTKSQIKNLITDRIYGNLDFTKIFFSNNQLVKTYKEVIRINSDLYRYLKYLKVDKYNKPKPKPKLLSITDRSYLDLTNDLEKDLIDFGDEEVKDLIDFDTIVPNKKPTAQDLLMDEELFPKVNKKYNILQDEDLIPTTTNPSANGVNILKNILNYPETKRILGISLTSDLKEKNKKFRL